MKEEPEKIICENAEHCPQKGKGDTEPPCHHFEPHHKTFDCEYQCGGRNPSCVTMSKYNVLIRKIKLRKLKRIEKH